MPDDFATNGRPDRVIVVVEESLPAGLAANAAAMLALTLGARVPGLTGAPLVDASGGSHPGLIPDGIPVLKASAAALRAIRERARDSDDVLAVTFPAAGQRTNDYEEVRRQVAATPPDDIEYAGVALHGPRKRISRLTGTLPLLR
jgi:hypothetical protein